MPLTAQQAFNLLQANPVGFLKRYPLKIRGAPNVGSGHHFFYLSPMTAQDLGGIVPRRPGSRLKTKSMHGTEAFEIHRDAWNLPLAPVDEHRFFTVWIESRGYTQANFRAITNPRATVLMTEMLTGCTFVVLPYYAGAAQQVQLNVPGQNLVVTLNNVGPTNGGGMPAGIQCAHVQCGNLGSEVLHDLLDQQFPQHAYGRRHYGHQTVDMQGHPSPDRTTAIVGVHGNNGWEVYAQKIRADINHYEVRSVYRIYPAPRIKM